MSGAKANMAPNIYLVWFQIYLWDAERGISLIPGGERK
jgi:hypothetical protein